MRRKLCWSAVKKALGTLNGWQPTIWTQDLGVKWELHANTTSKVGLVWSLWKFDLHSKCRENDLHMPPANPTSHKVNSVEEKTLANTEPQTPPLITVKNNSQNLILQQRSPPIFPKPSPSSALINLSSHFFNWIDVVFHPKSSRLWTQRTPYF
jgi:hypothetical protein